MNAKRVIILICAMSINAQSGAQEYPSVVWQSSYTRSKNWSFVSEFSFGQNILKATKHMFASGPPTFEVALNGFPPALFDEDVIPDYKNLVFSNRKNIFAIQINKRIRNELSPTSFSGLMLYRFDNKSKSWTSSEISGVYDQTLDTFPDGNLAGVSNDGEHYLFRTENQFDPETRSSRNAGWIVWNSDRVELNRRLEEDKKFVGANSAPIEWKFMKKQSSRRTATAKIGSKTLTLATDPKGESDLVVDGNHVAIHVRSPYTFHYSSVICNEGASVIAAVVLNNSNDDGAYSHILLSIFSDVSRKFESLECMRQIDLPANALSVSSVGEIFLQSRHLLLQITYGDQVGKGTYNLSGFSALSRKEWGIWSFDGLCVHSGIPESLFAGSFSGE